MMAFNSLAERVSRKASIYFKELFGTKIIYKYFFPAYWHKAICKSKTDKEEAIYIAPGINYGAGVGHQMYDWASQYLLIKQMGFQFVHKPLWVNGIHAEKDDATGVWNDVLGLGEGEQQLDALLKNGYKIVKLPAFGQEYSITQDEVLNMIHSYQGKKIVFQFAIDQPGIAEGVAQIFYDKFWNAKGRNHESYPLVYETGKWNIAVHIRRGDVSRNLPYKYRPNTFYYNAVMDIINSHKEVSKNDIKIYIFSEGKEEDYPEFKNLDNVTFCLDMNAKQTFIHLVNADVLVVAPSWFSANAAAINRRELYCSDEYHKFDTELNWTWLDKEGHIKE